MPVNHVDVDIHITEQVLRSKPIETYLSLPWMMKSQTSLKRTIRGLSDMLLNLS